MMTLTEPLLGLKSENGENDEVQARDFNRTTFGIEM